MGRTTFSGLWLLLAALVPSTAQAADKITTLPRTEKWVASFDDDSCRLVGVFGADKDQILIELAQYSPGSGFELSVMGQPVKTDDPFAKLKIGFGPDFNPVTVQTINGTRGKYPLRIVTSMDFGNQQSAPTTPAEIPATPPERVVRYLDVWANAHSVYRLDLGSMVSPMTVMHECMQNLVKSWGYAPDETANDAARAAPVGSPGNWLTSGDYPTELLRQGATGIVHFRLDVDEKGAVTGCHVQMSTKPAGFDVTTCKLIMQRAKFTPGHNAKGEPIKSYYVSTASWMIPEY